MSIVYTYRAKMGNHLRPIFYTKYQFVLLIYFLTSTDAAEPSFPYRGSFYQTHRLLSYTLHRVHHSQKKDLHKTFRSHHLPKLITHKSIKIGAVGHCYSKRIGSLKAELGIVRRNSADQDRLISIFSCQTHRFQ